jgi:uncharacterized protein YutE (UPF0331/DUF86 family)
VEAIKFLQKVYDSLDVAVNSAADLAVTFGNQKDKRKVKADKAVVLIMKAQELINSLCQDEDIYLF